MATLSATLPYSFATDLQPQPEMAAVVFQDQSFHQESFTSSPVYLGQIVIEPMTSTEKDSVETFYTTNRVLEWDWVNPLDGDTYNLYFTGPRPQPRLMNGSHDRYTITLQVIGEKV